MTILNNPQFFKDNALKMLHSDGLNEYPKDVWLELTKKYFFHLNHSEQISFRSHNSSYELYIEACKDENFIKRAIKEPGEHVFRPELNAVYDLVKTIKKWNFKVDSKVPIPYAKDVKKNSNYVKTMLAFISGCSDEQILYMYKTKKGLLHIENHFIDNMVEVDMGERLSLERVKLGSEQPPPLKSDEILFKQRLSFFEKNSCWRNLKNAPNSYYPQLLRLIDMGSENSYPWFSAVMSKDEMKDLAFYGYLNHNGNVNTFSVYGINEDWDTLFSDQGINVIKHLASKKDNGGNLRFAFSLVTNYLCGVYENNPDKLFSKGQSKALKVGLDYVFADKSALMYSPLPLILKMTSDCKNSFNLHMLCALHEYNNENLTNSFRISENTINCHGLELSDSINNVLPSSLVNELKKLGLEENVKLHQQLEHNFDVKLDAHPYLREMMLSAHLKKIDVPDNNQDEISQGQIFKL